MAGASLLPAPRRIPREGATCDAESGVVSPADIPSSLAFSRDGALVARQAAPETAFAFRLADGTRAEGGADGLAPAGMAIGTPGIGPDEALNDGAVYPYGRMAAIGARHRAEASPPGQAWVPTAWGWPAMDRRFIVFNGPAFSPRGDGIYHADSAERTIRRRAGDGDRPIPGPAEVSARLSDDAGCPDGAAIDDEGHPRSAHRDGARMTRYRPDGAVERAIGAPAARPTSLAFLGLDRDRVAITAALPDDTDPSIPPESDPADRIRVLSAVFYGPARPRPDAGLTPRLNGDRDVQALPRLWLSHRDGPRTVWRVQELRQPALPDRHHARSLGEVRP